MTMSFPPNTLVIETYLFIVYLVGAATVHIGMAETDDASIIVFIAGANLEYLFPEGF